LLRLLVISFATLLLDAPRGFAESGTIVNTNGPEVTLLAARVSHMSISSSVSLSQCDRLFSNIDGERSYDCRSALRQRFGIPVLQAHAYLKTTSSSEGTETVVDSTDLSLVEIVVAVKKESFARIGALGFYTTDSSMNIYFRRDQVRNSITVRLKDGTEAVLVSFLSLFPVVSQKTNWSPAQHFSIGFKPFADFHDAAVNKIYRHWDLAPNSYDNYYLYAGYGPTIPDLTFVDRRSTLMPTPVPIPWTIR